MNQDFPVYFETSHGTYRFFGRLDETVGGVLKRCGVPLVAVWTYIKEKPDHPRPVSTARPAPDKVRFVSTETRLADLRSRGLTGVFARASRNINYPDLPGIGSARLRRAEEPTTEWTFPDPDLGMFAPIKSELSQQECLDFAVTSVETVIKAWPEDLPRRLVVGTSGGGDSNIMVTALVASGFFQPEDLIPVMMLGIPDWDPLQEQARALCEEQGLRLRLVSGEEVISHLGIKVGLEPFFDHFKQHYPDVDLEFLGTWMLRKVLGGVGAAMNCRAIAIGANREDVLAECLARVSRGLPPLPMPFRKIGNHTLVYPMWKVPKKIGDGAYVKRSLSNYETRHPSFTNGRSAYYHLAYLIAEGAPGADLSLLKGMAELARMDAEPFQYDEELGDYVCRLGSDKNALEDWRAFLKAGKKA